MSLLHQLPAAAHAAAPALAVIEHGVELVLVWAAVATPAWYRGIDAVKRAMPAVLDATDERRNRGWEHGGEFDVLDHRPVLPP